ncbi:MAG: DUF3500 domain-containing protein [Chitinophagaceae bacterium]|jgi:hypothetical protein|nr:DUF3500 domain-containing protein [Chitinophagaceae bacterium]
MRKNKKSAPMFITLLNVFSFLLFIPFALKAQNNTADFSSALTVIHSFDSEQKTKSVFPFDEMSRYDWHYLPPSLIPRRGVCLKDLDSSQKKNVYALLKSFLSEKGFLRTQDIMNNEYYLKELEPNMIHRIPENHFIAFYGTPAKDSVWGWKFSGHHIALNFTIVNNQLALTPIFFGVYPAEIKEGKNKGRRIIKEEEDIGFELINMLTSEQKAKAIFQSKAFSDIVTTNAIQVGPLTPVGIVANDLTTQQKNILNKLIVSHLSSMPTKIAEMRMKRIVSEDFNQIRFGWAGGFIKGVPHYYRIQGKTFLIEFDNTTHNANHIHIVWRDFNGDFGVDLLNEHYKKSKHHHK